MRRVSFTVIALLAALVVTTVGAQTYGTKVDEAWYDMVAEAYQNPPFERTDRGWSFNFQYSDSYPSTRLTPLVAEDGTVSYRPDEDGPCELQGTARVAEDLMQWWVRHLHNLTEGPGAASFKEALLRFGEAGVIAVSPGFAGATVLSDGVRYPGLDVQQFGYLGTRMEYYTSYWVFFSLRDLQELGAIVDDSITVVTGLLPESRCTFDLNQLP